MVIGELAISGFKSEWDQVISGVPQGSVLGLLLMTGIVELVMRLVNMHMIRSDEQGDIDCKFSLILINRKYLAITYTVSTQ